MSLHFGPPHCLVVWFSLNLSSCPACAPTGGLCTGWVVVVQVGIKLMAWARADLLGCNFEAILKHLADELPRVRLFAQSRAVVSRRTHAVAATAAPPSRRPPLANPHAASLFVAAQISLTAIAPGSIPRRLAFLAPTSV